MPNIFPAKYFPYKQKILFRWHHLIANNCDSTIKSLTFYFWLKNKIPPMKLLTLSKTFPYLLNFALASFDLVTYLALYKEDQATH